MSSREAAFSAAGGDERRARRPRPRAPASSCAATARFYHGAHTVTPATASAASKVEQRRTPAWWARSRRRRPLTRRRLRCGGAHRTCSSSSQEDPEHLPSVGLLGTGRDVDGRPPELVTTSGAWSWRRARPSPSLRILMTKPATRPVRGSVRPVGTRVVFARRPPARPGPARPSRARARARARAAAAAAAAATPSARPRASAPPSVSLSPAAPSSSSRSFLGHRGWHVPLRHAVFPDAARRRGRGERRELDVGPRRVHDAVGCGVMDASGASALSRSQGPRRSRSTKQPAHDPDHAREGRSTDGTGSTGIAERTSPSRGTGSRRWGTWIRTSHAHPRRPWPGGGARSARRRAHPLRRAGHLGRGPRLPRSSGMGSRPQDHGAAPLGVEWVCARARPTVGTIRALVDLMEGVEDIPEASAASAEGPTRAWEPFSGVHGTTWRRIPAYDGRGATGCLTDALRMAVAERSRRGPTKGGADRRRTS